MAAILDFPFVVSFCLVVQHYHYPYLIVGLRKHRYSNWNFVAILYYHFRFDWKLFLVFPYVGLLDSENIGLAVEIAFLFCLKAEI